MIPEIFQREKSAFFTVLFEDQYKVNLLNLFTYYRSESKVSGSKPVMIILMGVSGCGKTTVGKRLASLMHLPFLDADDLHPRENILKMERGIPLDDSDRAPWLRILKRVLVKMKEKGGGIVACSALKAEYRRVLQEGAGRDAHFVFLKGSKDLIRRRLNRRQGHFMKQGLLDSQFRDLEEPEDALVLSIKASPEALCRRILATLKTDKTTKAPEPMRTEEKAG